MSDDSCPCIPLRLRTTDSEPVSPIFWGRAEFSTIDHFTIPFGPPTDRKAKRFDVRSRERKLVGDQLIWELDIAPYAPPASSFTQKLKAAWDKKLPERRAEKGKWTLYGVAAGALIVALLLVLRDALVALFLNPLASMVWVWATLGWYLPLVALVAGIVIIAHVASWRRPFYFGLALVAGIALPLFAAQFAETVAEALGDAPQFPDTYFNVGQAAFNGLIDSTAAFYTELKFIWTPITLLLNGAGLAGVVTLVDKLGGWAVTTREERLAAAEAKEEGDLDISTFTDRQSRPAFTLSVPLKPLDAPMDVVPARPDSC